MHEIDKIEYSRGCSHIGTCWIQNCWQSLSRICLTSFHSSTLLLQKIISSFKVFCTGMHEIDKIEYSRGCSVNFCKYSILIFYLVVFFPSGRPMVIFSLACLVVKNILSFRRSLYIYIYIYIIADAPMIYPTRHHCNQKDTQYACELCMWALPQTSEKQMYGTSMWITILAS